MFKLPSFFNKTNWKIEKESFDLFENVFAALPEDFRFLLEHLHRGVYRRYMEDSSPGKNLFGISFDPAQSDRSMVKGKDFRLENIRIVTDDHTYDMHLSIYSGLWIAFELEPRIKDLRNYRVDVSHLKYVANSKRGGKAIQKLLKNLHSEQLDLSDLAQIELDGTIYYQIRDLQDGNYLAMDGQGRVFGLMHDPFKIELISGSIRQFVKEINSGEFSAERYLETGNGRSPKEVS